LDVYKWYPVTGSYRDVMKFWRRRRVEALKGVNLTVPHGASVGLLGTNGAGKTTLLKLLAGLMLPNRGQVYIHGVDATRDFGRIRHRLAYVPNDERTHYWRLSGRQNLEFYGSLYEVPRHRLKARVTELLELVGITERADEIVAKYSTGMRQRLALARGLIAEPRIMLLDEPTRSLDPVGARHMRSFIKEELIRKQGVTVLIATHDMEEATYLCDQVAIIDAGRIRFMDYVDNLRSLVRSHNRVQLRVIGLPEQALSALRRMPEVIDLKWQSPNGIPAFVLELSVADPNIAMPRILEKLAANDCGVLEASQQRPGLGDVLVALSEGRL
jgi:ABC-2 type transport system ATP-binding protein